MDVRLTHGRLKDDGSLIVLGVSEPRSAITRALCRLWGRDWCPPLLSLDFAR